jgi:hypothetical protein
MMKQGTVPRHVRDLWAQLPAEKLALLHVCTAIEDGHYERLEVRHKHFGLQKRTPALQL